MPKLVSAAAVACLLELTKSDTKECTEVSGCYTHTQLRLLTFEPSASGVMPIMHSYSAVFANHASYLLSAPQQPQRFAA